MAMFITDACIPCGACEPTCPNVAISEGSDAYVVDFHLCAECVGFYDERQFALVCPVDAVIFDPDHEETKEELKAKYLRLFLIALRQAVGIEGSENVPDLPRKVGSTQSEKKRRATNNVCKQHELSDCWKSWSGRGV